jgi:DNA-binding MarR family transcriptional regulator
VDTRTDLATELFHVVGRFRRQLRRAGSGFDATGLTQSQAELLRLVGRQPGISVREAAAELGLVPNTASTLVSKLAADGLLIRTVDTDDRRVGRLRLTEPAQRIADESRAARRAALSAVLDELDAGQLENLSSGLRVLGEMTHMLHESEMRTHHESF